MSTVRPLMALVAVLVADSEAASDVSRLAEVLKAYVKADEHSHQVRGEPLSAVFPPHVAEDTGRKELEAVGVLHLVFDILDGVEWPPQGGATAEQTGTGLGGSRTGSSESIGCGPSWKPSGRRKPEIRKERRKKIEIEEQKLHQVRVLFEQFLETYAASEEGQKHIRLYGTSRAQGRKNFAQVAATRERGEAITDAVLLKLLPHSDTLDNRDRGGWIHPTRSGHADIQEWHERVGWTEPADWSRVARAIFEFIRRCHGRPADLAAACRAFDALSYSKGFQTGMLTPILNALRPDQYLLVNKEWRATVRHFAGVSHTHEIREYPRTNASGWEVLDKLAPHMHQFDLPSVRDSDLLDVFSYWLAMIKDFSFRPVRYWRIVPGENTWDWDVCREGGFSAIGWNRVGDLTGMAESDFQARLDALRARYPEEGWNRREAGQVWRFVHEIQEGDWIVATREPSTVLGLGVVEGPYQFEPGARRGHRVPVEWRDLTRQQITQAGWKKTLMELSRAEFQRIRRAAAMDTTREVAAPFSTIFQDREEAEWAFDLLHETLYRLGVSDYHDERFSLMFQAEKRILRLSFGDWWCLLQFASPDWSNYRVGLALLDDQAARTSASAFWKLFAGTEAEPSVSVYRFPVDAVRPPDGALRHAYEKTFAYVAERFEGLEESKYRSQNVMPVARAVVDQEERSQLLTGRIECE